MLDAAESHTFGSLLRRHRLAAGLTQAALAERAGIAERTIQDLENEAAGRRCSSSAQQRFEVTSP